MQYIIELKNKSINEVVFRKQKEAADMTEYESKKSRLRSMLRDEQITNEEYKTDLAVLDKRYAVGVKVSNVDWFLEMNKIVDLATCLTETLENGTLKAKRLILSELGL